MEGQALCELNRRGGEESLSNEAASLHDLLGKPSRISDLSTTYFVIGPHNVPQNVAFDLFGLRLGRIKTVAKKTLQMFPEHRHQSYL